MDAMAPDFSAGKKEKSKQSNEPIAPANSFYLNMRAVLILFTLGKH